MIAGNGYNKFQLYIVRSI